MQIIKVKNINELSQEFMRSPFIINNLSDYILYYDFTLPDGKYDWKGISFIDTIAYRKTRGNFLNPHYMGSFNDVCIVEDSDWLNELKSRQSKDAELKYYPDFTFKHYIVYFEGYGTFEFIAQDVKLDAPKLEDIINKILKHE